MPFTVPPHFLWGASTSAHQTEGNNVSSDWWSLEHSPETFVVEPSGDAVDSFHRWTQDMDLLAGAGMTDYRFSVEWARVEPVEGKISRASIAHYRRMVRGALARGIRPMLTLHHFTLPAWFSAQGGWLHPRAEELFARFVDIAAEIVQDDVERVCTINEPNMVAIFNRALIGGGIDFANGLPAADPELTDRLIGAHVAARDVLRRNHPNAKVGWSVAMQSIEPLTPADADAAREYAAQRETRFVEAAADDDWFGVQSYTRSRVRAAVDGPQLVRAPEGAERTLTGWEFYPPALGGAVREAARILGNVPIIVTENGIATDDDARRIAYTEGALAGLQSAIDDGIRVEGYYHWSLLDNYEWGSFVPTFGLVAVDRLTFERTAKPSLAWLGGLRAAAGEAVR